AGDADLVEMGIDLVVEMVTDAIQHETVQLSGAAHAAHDRRHVGAGFEVGDRAVELAVEPAQEGSVAAGPPTPDLVDLALRAGAEDAAVAHPGRRGSARAARAGTRRPARAASCISSTASSSSRSSSGLSSTGSSFAARFPAGVAMSSRSISSVLF